MIKEMCSHLCSTGIRFGRSKLVQSCSNFKLKPELEPTVTVCLAGRDAQEVLYTDLSKHRAAIARHLQFCNADIHKRDFPQTYTVWNELQE